MITFPMLWSLSALVERPSAPTARQSIASRHSNGTSYPFSFQYGCQPSFPSWLNGKPSIPFPFILLRTFSVATGGVHPPPPISFSLPCVRLGLGRLFPVLASLHRYFLTSLLPSNAGSFSSLARIRRRAASRQPRGAPQRAGRAQTRIAPSS